MLALHVKLMLKPGEAARCMSRRGYKQQLGGRCYVSTAPAIDNLLFKIVYLQAVVLHLLSKYGQRILQYKLYGHFFKDWLHSTESLLQA